MERSQFILSNLCIPIVIVCLSGAISISATNNCFDEKVFLKYFEKTERGIEIRYYVSENKLDKSDKEILIDGIKYPIYASKEKAIEAVTNSNVKKDYTIVYVYSEKKKETEIILIKE